MLKKISILGSTGSIGLSTLKIIKKKKKFFKINLLTANKNYNLICDQINFLNQNISKLIMKRFTTKLKKYLKKTKQ